MEGAIQHMYFLQDIYIKFILSLYVAFRNMICLWVSEFDLDCIAWDEGIKHASCSKCKKNLLVFSALCL